MPTWILPILLSAQAGPARPEVMLPLLAKPPVIDGVIDETEWAGAVRSIGLVGHGTGLLDPRDAVFWVGADSGQLYLALRTLAPSDGKLLTRAVPDGDRDVVAALRDDSVECVIHPHLGATAGDRRYFHFIVNERGAMFDRSFDEGNPDNPMSLPWRLKGWTFKNSLRDGWWEVEMAIPLTSLGATEADLTHPWGVRVGRNFQRAGAQVHWESARAAYEDIPTMPRVSFAADAPVVQVLSLRGESAPRHELAVANPGTKPVPVKVLIADTWFRNPPKELEESFTLAPGERKSVVFEPPHGGKEGPHLTVLKVTSPDGQRVYYQREFTWQFERDQPLWSIGAEERQAVGLQYAVYPYHRRLKVRVDVQSLAGREQVTGATVTFGREGAAPAASGALSFRDHIAEAVFETGELTAGGYRLAVTLQGGEQVPKEPVTRTWSRTVFPWEHNTLGKSDRVIPPFEPITVKGRHLTTVLRRHELGGGGVWDQVTSLDRPLLTGPMRFEVVADGQDQAVRAGEPKVVSSKPTQAVTEGGFSAGPVRATVRSTWDFDGLAKTVIRIEPAAGRSVDRLTLVVPLDDRQTRYLHACGDGLRSNFAGLTPPGEGVVWDSSQANRVNLRNPFYPYVWVGGGERGLVWCADNDRGWSLDDQTPTVVLERRGGTLLLKVSFITRATPLDAPRSIEFGLQATPAKPMAEQPVNWRRWLGRSYADQKVQPFAIMGSCPYYGMLSFDLYPIDHDLSIYQAYSKARDSGQPDWDFAAEWLKKYLRWYPKESERYDFYDKHIRAGTRTAAGTPRRDGWLWTPYTNPRGMGFTMAEWPVFQDEWTNSPYLERSTEGAISYDACPVESLRDAWMWSYREMLTCFDGVYWDNIYLAANQDTIAGGAWIDQRGEVHPSVGLWDMRELIRRTAIFLHEQGRTAYANVPHMTNTNLVPVLSFATVNLDWEWQYGNRDFQDRFTPELTVAETIGRQCGNIPLILSGGISETDPAKKAWIHRTRTGVCLVHEIRVWDWQPEAHYELQRKLYELGYGTPGCRVYNYWDEGFPLRIEGLNGRGIVMATAQRAVVGVTDYGEGGEARVTLDLKAIGLTPTKATDLETGEAVPLSGAELRFPLKKHDYRVVVVD